MIQPLRLLKTATRLPQSFFYSSNSQLRKTSLYDFHLRNNAKMFNFEGWNMPLQYESSPTTEHNLVRSFLGLFDVSHMRQVSISGPDSAKLLDYATVAGIFNMKPGTSLYTVMLNEDAGIVDDLIVSKDSENEFYAVLNCSQAMKDLSHLKTISDENNWTVNIEELNNSLLAIQGPQSHECLQRGFDVKLNNLLFMNNLSSVTAFGIPDCRLSRCGYTGEDGFELMVPNDCVEFVAMEVLSYSKSNKKGALIGLAARDSLRIEAGLCLYGNELNESINIKDAGLSWVLKAKKLKEKSFLGWQKLREIMESPRQKIRMGLICETGTPMMRAGTALCNQKGNSIGHVTSSCSSKFLEAHIAMGYVNFESANDSLVVFKVRGKQYEARLVKIPFIQPQYYNFVY